MSVKDYKELELCRLAFDAAMEIFEKCGYIQEAAHKKLSDKYDHICRQLYTMMKDASSWYRSFSSLHALRSTLHAPRAFTLIELIVVVAVIALLIALLIPNIREAREKAWSTTCQNNLKQYGMALNKYLMSIGSGSGGGSGVDGGIYGISASGTRISPGRDPGEMITVSGGTLPSDRYFSGGDDRGGIGSGSGNGGHSYAGSILDNLPGPTTVTLQSLNDGIASVRICPVVLRQIQEEGNFFDPNSPNRKGYQRRLGDTFVYVDFQGNLTNVTTNVSESAQEGEDAQVGYTLDGQLILSGFTTYAANPDASASSPQNAIAFIDWNAKEGWGAGLGDAYTNWMFNSPDGSIVQDTPKWTNAWWLTEIGFYHPLDGVYGANYVAMDGHVGWISSNDISPASFTSGVGP